jgi:hypothetical protein
MIAFAMIVRDELRDDAPEVPLPQRNDSIETFFPDRPDESFCVGIRIRRTFGDQHDTDARLLESTPYVTAPLPIPITDQNVRAFTTPT